MKTGKSLTELAVEVDRQREISKDYIAPQGLLDMDENLDVSIPVNDHSEKFVVSEIAHDQIAQKLDIPAGYYNRMRASSPELLRDNVNHWFTHQPARRLVRTQENRLRAFLSDRYRPLDNFDLLQSVLPVIAEMKADVEVASCEITEKKMYLKCLLPKVQGEIKVGDIVESGFAITNSEIGMATLTISPLLYRLVCRNGAIINEHAMRQTHIGGRIGQGDDPNSAFYRDDTLKAEDQAFFLKVRDLIRATAGQVGFDQIIQKIKINAGIEIKQPALTVERVQKNFTMSNKEGEGIMRFLVQGGDISWWGMTNAVTRLSHEIESYDRATEL